MVGIAVTGGSGRMGQMLIREIAAQDGAQLSAVIERPGHDWIGQDAGTAMGGAALDVTVTDGAEAAIAAAEVLVDFTAPDATARFASLAAEAGTAHVIGTTGFDGTHLQAIAEAAGKIAIVRAGNMSLGVNLLTMLTRQVAAALGESFDIEIVETHHNRKVDAPSGTALMLGEAAAEGRGRALEDIADRARDGITGMRKPGDIGFAALRGGDVVGEHDVIFAGPGERIVLRHIADDRSLFAKGAIRAALWATDQLPGEYDMLDVLKLR